MCTRTRIMTQWLEEYWVRCCPLERRNSRRLINAIDQKYKSNLNILSPMAKFHPFAVWLAFRGPIFLHTLNTRMLRLKAITIAFTIGTHTYARLIWIRRIEKNRQREACHRVILSVASSNHILRCESHWSRSNKMLANSVTFFAWALFFLRKMCFCATQRSWSLWNWKFI